MIPTYTESLSRQTMDEKICVTTTHPGLHISPFLLSSQYFIPLPLLLSIDRLLVTRRKTYTFVESLIFFIHEQEAAAQLMFLLLRFHSSSLCLCVFCCRRLLSSRDEHCHCSPIALPFVATYSALSLVSFPVVLFSPEFCDSLFFYLLKLLTLW